MTSLRATAFLDQLRSRLWFIPGTLAIGSALLAFTLVGLDRLVDESVGSRLSGLLFSGGPDSARLVLSTIAAAMLTFTGLVFTVTMLVLQLASAQLSPRVMRTFLRDRVTQSVLGIFIATFLYALLLLRDVRSPADAAFVPVIAVTVAYLLVLASVGLFVVYIHHVAQAIRATTVLRSVGDETRDAIRRIYPEDVGVEPSPPVPSLPERQADAVAVRDHAPGVITSVDEEALVDLATEHTISVELLHMVGDFVPTGAPLLRVWRRLQEKGNQQVDEAELPLKALARAVQIGTERTMTQDTAFGFRQIVDIAERALSPGINDPTTAVQALDELHDLLRRLAGRRIPSPMRLADDGSVLLRMPRPDWDDYMSLALDEIRLFGAGSIQIARRMRYLLLDLKDAAPGFRQAPITRQLHLLDAALASSYEFREDRRAAAEPSPSGQGPEEVPTPAPPSEADQTGAAPTTA